MSELKYENCYVPFTTTVPGGLGVGRIIKIKGKTDYTREPRFCVNLGIAPAFHEYIALHISPRQHEETIVITHLRNGVWGAEQIYKNPIHHNKDHFELKIYVQADCYKIELRDHHLASVPFTYPPHDVNHIEIEGGVKIDHVHIEGHPVMAAPMMAAPQVVMTSPAPTVYVEQRPPMVVMAPPTVIVEPRRPAVVIAPPIFRPAPIIVERRGPVVVDRHGPVVVNRHGPVVVNTHPGIGHRRI